LKDLENSLKSRNGFNPLTPLDLLPLSDIDSMTKMDLPKQPLSRTCIKR